MYKIKAINPRLTHEYGRGTVLSVEVDADSLAEARALVDDLRTGYVSVSVGKWTNGKSPTAMAYFWALIDKITQSTRQPKREVYKQVVRDIGGNSIQRSVRKDALESWRRQWESNGSGWIVEEAGEFDGYVDTINYYGCSAYDASQMSRLIESAEAEARNLGIPLRRVR